MGASLHMSNRYLLQGDRHLPLHYRGNYGTTDSLHLATQASETTDLLAAAGNPSRVCDSPQIPPRGYIDRASRLLTCMKAFC